MKRSGLKMKGIIFILGMMLFSAPLVYTSCSPGKNSSQHKMEKQRAKKDKEAKKKYDQAIKQHQKNQSAATKAMMKEAKKESPKNTPLKPSSGKKCK